MDIISSIKISDMKLEVTSQPKTPDPVTQTYDRDFLEKQKKDIQTQWNFQIENINKLRQSELDDIDAILAEMDKMGIVTSQKEK